MSASCAAVTTESAGMSLIMSARLGLDQQRPVRQGPKALEALKQLVKFIGEYRHMLGSPVWLLRTFQNELGLFMRALVRSYMLPH